MIILLTSLYVYLSYMKRILLIMFMLIASASSAFAQWEEYVPPCEHQGNEDIWKIVRYKPGTAAWEKWEPANGRIKWSDSCVEFECDQLLLYFDVDRYEKMNSNPPFFKVYRREYDELFDYMEVRDGIGIDKGMKRIIMGRRDDDGNIQGAIMILCKPYTMTTPTKFRPCVGGMH